MDLPKRVSSDPFLFYRLTAYRPIYWRSHRTQRNEHTEQGMQAEEWVCLISLILGSTAKNMRNNIDSMTKRVGGAFVRSFDSTTN